MTTNHGPRPRREHDGRGRFVANPDTAVRDAAACRLRSQGRTYDEVAAELGFSHRDLARRAVRRALQATLTEPAEELRSLELTRLDALWSRAWAVLEREHMACSAGRVVVDPGTGRPVRDDGPVLQAIDRLLRIQERRARLLGLDAPVRAEVVTADQVDAEISRLAAMLGVPSEERLP